MSDERALETTRPKQLQLDDIIEDPTLIQRNLEFIAHDPQNPPKKRKRASKHGTKNPSSQPESQPSDQTVETSSRPLSTDTSNPMEIITSTPAPKRHATHNGWEDKDGTFLRTAGQFKKPEFNGSSGDNISVAGAPGKVSRYSQHVHDARKVFNEGPHVPGLGLFPVAPQKAVPSDADDCYLPMETTPGTQNLTREPVKLADNPEEVGAAPELVQLILQNLAQSKNLVEGLYARVQSLEQELKIERDRSRSTSRNSNVGLDIVALRDELALEETAKARLQEENNKLSDELIESKAQMAVKDKELGAWKSRMRTILDTES
ncbi:MAG: hypothetical protein M1812_004354 [Candelaria pacifica]|nr:MAG: hypothetical protein M1812_004354 [Candelaria pacifica]